MTAVLALVLGACGVGGDDAADLSSGAPDSPTATTATPDGAAPPSTEPAPGAAAPGAGAGASPPAGDVGGAPGAARPPAAGAQPSSPSPFSGPRSSSPRLGDVQLRLTRIAALDQPLALVPRAGDGALYVAEKGGRVRAIRGGQVDSDPVLDISGDVSTGSEQGLLGLAFSPDGGRLYVNYTDTDGDTHIVEYAMAGGRAAPDSRREVMVVDQPSPMNNGGNLVFGPDGRLWIGLGDGGPAGDPNDNAQSLGTLLGKMLRIDPRPTADAAYSVPPDNPFVGRNDARPEIWAYGLRNPWRYSFDRSTGDLWIGDVGQNAREEIDLQPAGVGGQNYGWARVEGTSPYRGRAPGDAVPPLTDYGRSAGNCSITGGYVYRGNRLLGLVGAYLYGDRCGGELRAIRQSGGQVVDARTFPQTVRLLSSFGQDNGGELYALSLDGNVFRIDPG